MYSTFLTLIKFSWKVFILWAISNGLSVLRYAINLSSCLKTLEIGQIPRMTVHKKCLIKKFSTKFDDLGVIIMGNRCSIQQGEENNYWLEQSPENWLYRLFRFFEATRYEYAVILCIMSFVCSLACYGIRKKKNVFVKCETDLCELAKCFWKENEHLQFIKK